MHLVSTWLFSNKPNTTAPALQTSEHPLTQLIKDKVNLEKTPEPLLWTLKNKLQCAGVEESHPIRQEIDKRLSLKTKPILNGVQSRAIQMPRATAPAENTYIQPTKATIEETLKSLEPLEGKLDTIELCLANDDLMAFIAQKFPQLKTLKLVDRIGTQMWMNFTDKGLESVSQCKMLESLVIDLWDHLVMVSYNGFTKMLGQPHFAVQIKDLTLNTFFLVNDAMPVLAQYKQLKHLHMHAAWIKESGLMALLQSPTLKKSVVDFSFTNSQEVALSDNTLNKLKEFDALERIVLADGSLSKDWKVSDPVLVSFLDTQKKLKTLDLQGPALKDPMAEKIGQMTQLENLRLDNCSGVSYDKGWKQLLNAKEKLAYLDIGQTLHLTEESMPYISQLPLSFLSIDVGNSQWASSKWMETLCTSPTLKKQLKTLHLKNLADLKSDAYAYLQALENLSSLRLEKCYWFNDDSLKLLSESAARKTLTNFEVIETCITDNAISLLPRFEKLQNLLLGKCYALSKIGYDLLLTDPTLREKLVVYAIDNFSWTVDQLLCLANFKALNTLIISNDDSVPLDGLDRLFKMAEEHGFNMRISWGITRYIEDFEEAVKDLPQ